MSDPVGINLDILMDAACNDQAIAATLLKLFFELTGQEKTRLTDAVAQGNFATASAVAHKIAGSCASCGMSGVAALFRELEHLCKESLPTDIRERLQTIDLNLQNIRYGLEKHFNCSLAP